MNKCKTIHANVKQYPHGVSGWRMTVELGTQRNKIRRATRERERERRKKCEKSIRWVRFSSSVRFIFGGMMMNMIGCLVPFTFAQTHTFAHSWSYISATHARTSAHIVPIINLLYVNIERNLLKFIQSYFMGFGNFILTQ